MGNRSWQAVGRGWGAAQRLPVPRTTGNNLAKNISGAEFEKPWIKGASRFLQL